MQLIASAQKDDYRCIPDATTWQANPEAAYCHYTSNETLTGLEFSGVPTGIQAPLVCDMTSSIFSQPFDISKFGMVYAGSQKNMGLAGLTLVIVRKDLIQPPHPLTVPALSYQAQFEQASLLITPPTFTWYVCGLIVQWLKKQGGLAAIGKINQRKANKLYQVIDNNADIYHNQINPVNRSRMNVFFKLPNKDLEDLFIAQAEKKDLMALRGHRVTGGIRACIYNHVPESSVDALVDFMTDFANERAS